MVSLTRQLEEIAARHDFDYLSGKLLPQVRAADITLDLERVQEVLQFMEENPTVDFGAPGALTVFVEQFHGRGYEPLLIASIRRKPTPHTLSMLNRLINGAKDDYSQRELLEVMGGVLRRDDVDEETKVVARDFLD
jgi:hypothetical protein